MYHNNFITQKKKAVSVSGRLFYYRNCSPAVKQFFKHLIINIAAFPSISPNPWKQDDACIKIKTGAAAPS